MSAVSLALALLLAQKGDPPPPPAVLLPDTYSSKYYDLKTNATKDQAAELLEFMDLVHVTYMQLLRPKDPRAILSKRATLILYAIEENYQASQTPPGTRAFYNRATRELVGWYHPVMMSGFFAREGMHQFTDLTSKNYEVYPMWFSGGIADCFGACEVRDQKLYMGVKSASSARARLAVIQKALREGRQFPLSALLTLTPADAGKQLPLAQAQSWSFCHFLIAYPLHEDRTRQVPDGKYRRNIAAYYELLRAGAHTPSEAWESAFAGIDLAELEEQWKKHATAMDGGRYFGFEGTDIATEEAVDLRLASGQGGVRIERVGAGGVAEKAGLQVGDVVVAFDGRVLPRGRAITRIRTWFQEVDVDKPVTVRIMRDGKSVEVKAVWTRANPNGQPGPDDDFPTPD